MSADGEMESWRRQWQGAATPRADAEAVEQLRRRVVRETFWSKWGLVFPALVTLWTGATVVTPALRSGQGVAFLVGVESLVLIVALWVIALLLGRGTWRPLADTTVAFIDVSIRRREAYIRGAVVGACLYVGQFVFLVLALGLGSPAGFGTVLKSTQVTVLGWIGIPVVLVGLYWFGRQQRAELGNLRELKRQLQSD